MTRTARGAGIVVVAAVLLAPWFAWPAEACGYWFLHDREFGFIVDYRYHRVDVYGAKAGLKRQSEARETKKGSEKTGRRVPKNFGYLKRTYYRGRAVIYRTTPKKPLFAFDGQTLLWRGKPAGTLTGETLTIGERTFAIRVFKRGAKEKNSDALPWGVEVRRGHELVARAPLVMTSCMNISGPYQSLKRRIERRYGVRIKFRYGTAPNGDLTSTKHTTLAGKAEDRSLSQAERLKNAPQDLHQQFGKLRHRIIRRHVAFYYAWRELIAAAHGLKPLPALKDLPPRFKPVGPTK